MSAALQIARPPPPVQIPPAIAVAMREEAKELYEDAKAGVWPRMPKWVENEAFYRGQHYGQANDAGWWPQQTVDEEQETYNLIRSFVRTAAADILRHMPNPEVVASADDPQQVARAEFAHRMCRSWTDNGTLAFAEYERAVLDSMKFGFSFLKVFWNPKKGRERRAYLWEVGPDGQHVPLRDGFGAQRVRKDSEGDVDVTAHDIFSVWPDPHATRWADVRYIVEKTECAMGKAFDEFPVDYMGNSTRNRWSTTPVGMEEYSSRSIAQGMEGVFIPGFKAKSNTPVTICRLYELPTNEYPDGRFIAWCDDLILAIGPCPVFPWVPVYGYNRTMELFPDGIVDDLKCLQRTYNLQMTMLKEHMSTFAPGIFEPRGANMNIDEVENRAGWVARYTQGFKPEYADPPQLPNAAFAMGASIKGDMKDISTVSDISRGEAPPGAESGVAMRYLHEFEKGVHGPDVQLFRLTHVEVLRKMLRLSSMYYQDGRLVTMLGEQNTWTALAFNRQDCDFEVALIVEPMSGAPASKALRQDEIMRAVQFGILTPAEAKKMLNYDTADRNSYDPVQMHRSEARRENFLWRQDPVHVLLEAVPAEDHATHVEEHNKERASRFYKELPPEARQAIDLHVMWHEYMAMNQLGGWAQQEQVLDGGGAPPPPQDMNGGSKAAPISGGETAGPGAPIPQDVASDGQRPNAPAPVEG